ncbi:FbpB family small basic protein [Peribacillus sp. Bi96]|nr:FbpB family small basic protein [Peribacillus sp. Bi96]
MMKKRKRTFEELIKENKKELLMDLKQMERLEERIEKRHMQKAE